MRTSRDTGAAVVSVDAIRRVGVGREGSRLLVWGMADAMIRSLFDTGYRGVILDAGNFTASQRDRWRQMGARVLVKVLPGGVSGLEWEPPQEGEETVEDLGGLGFLGIPEAAERGGGR